MASYISKYLFWSITHPPEVCLSGRGPLRHSGRWWSFPVSQEEMKLQTQLTASSSTSALEETHLVQGKLQGQGTHPTPAHGNKVTISIKH